MSAKDRIEQQEREQSLSEMSALVEQLRNERQEEYYARVDAANRRYAGGEGGWTSDRGSVLVQYGEPERVERRGGTTEVWIYPRLNRRFLFVDQGRGAYRLQQPSWDERTRM